LAEANLLSLADAVVLPEQTVTPGSLRPEQAILGRVSEINAYIEAHPDQGEAVGFVLAAAQGPKGLMMWAADKALSETSFGEKVAQYQAHLEGVLGKAIAEGVEREELDVEYDDDAYLLGGGGLIATLLVGSAVGGAGSKVIKVKGSNPPAPNHNPHSGQADAEAGIPYEHPIKVGEGSKEAAGTATTGGSKVVPNTTKLLQTRSAEAVNEAMIAAGNKPAWLKGTQVNTEIVPSGTRYQMVVSEGQAQALMEGKPAFGGFATPENIPSQAFARDKLVILEEFKPDVSYAITVETTAVQKLNSGFTGPLGSYRGGVRQVEFLDQRSLKMIGQPKPLPWE